MLTISLLNLQRQEVLKAPTSTKTKLIQYQLFNSMDLQQCPFEDEASNRLQDQLQEDQQSSSVTEQCKFIANHRIRCY